MWTNRSCHCLYRKLCNKIRSLIYKHTATQSLEVRSMLTFIEWFFLASPGPN